MSSSLKLSELVTYLDKELIIDSIPDKCPNGLQVEAATETEEIKKIGFAVDVTIKTIEKAIEQQVDILITHHGLFYGSWDRLVGLDAKRLSLLLKNNISVYTAHLPMDIHRRYSHSLLLAHELGMYGVTAFGKIGDSFLGYRGFLRRKAKLPALTKRVDTLLSANSQSFAYGPEDLSSIAIVSGSGGFSIEEAGKLGVDCLLTGEISHDLQMRAKDLGISLILAGHYETEVLGLKKLLQTVTKKFKIECLFIQP